MSSVISLPFYSGGHIRQPIAVVHPSTYDKELFNNDETNWPAPDHLQNYLSGYRFDGPDGVPAPASLQDQTRILSDYQPMAFLCLGPGPGGGAKVTVLHWMMRCMDMPGEEASGYHDTIIGLQGDIAHASSISGRCSAEHGLPLASGNTSNTSPGVHDGRNEHTPPNLGGPSHAFRPICC